LVFLVVHRDTPVSRAALWPDTRALHALLLSGGS
jgi:hypothetical protein